MLHVTDWSVNTALHVLHHPLHELWLLPVSSGSQTRATSGVSIVGQWQAALVSGLPLLIILHGASKRIVPKPEPLNDRLTALNSKYRCRYRPVGEGITAPTSFVAYCESLITRTIPLCHPTLFDFRGKPGRRCERAERTGARQLETKGERAVDIQRVRSRPRTLNATSNSCAHISSNRKPFPRFAVNRRS